MDGPAGREQAARTDVHQAIGQDVRKEPAKQRHDVEVGGAWACTAHVTVGTRDRAVRARDDTTMGESDPEAIGGEGGEGRVAVVLGLPVDVPRDGPHLGGDGLQPSSVAQGCCAESAGDGGEGVDRDNEVGSGGAPGRAVRGEATARDEVVEVGGPGVVGPRDAGRRCKQGGPSR